MRGAHPHYSNREKLIERENEKLRKENNGIREIQRVVPVM
jgi:hypothetical protein